MHTLLKCGSVCVFCFSVVNYSVTLVPDASGDSGDFFCVKAEELTYGKKIKDSLFPWYDLPVRLSLARALYLL